jgi:hypothetical protein
MLHEIWLDRNHQLHSNDETAIQRQLETIIKPKLTRLYNLQHLVPIQYRQLYNRSIDEVIQLPPADLETWITRHENTCSMLPNKSQTEYK